MDTCIGWEDGRGRVKLEQHRLVTESGLELLSRFPCEGKLAGEEDGARYVRALLIRRGCEPE